MTFINSGVPNSGKGISFVLYYEALYCIAEKCYLYNNVVISYISKEASSTFKPMLHFVLHRVMVRKGSFD